MYYLEVDLDKCNGCGVCTSVCPHNSSFDVMTRGGKGFVTQNVLIGVKGGSSTVMGEHIVSEYCGECVLNCPQHAIRLFASPKGDTSRTIPLEAKLEVEEVTLDDQVIEIDIKQFNMKRADSLHDTLTQLLDRYKQRQVRQALSRGRLDRAEKLLKGK